jgi:segregation and condensation protein B
MWLVDTFCVASTALGGIHSAAGLAMAFDLQHVIKALLFASPGSLSVREIQEVFTRFHEESSNLPGLNLDGEEAAARAVAIDPAEVPSLVTAAQIREAMAAIHDQLEAAGEAYRLQETHQGWRLVTSPDTAEWVRLLRKQPRPLKLSQSALETLAIVAYRQPVVRAEIESIRGVSVESPLNRLLERELIRITGRADLPGRPIQYGTTDAFLEFVGVTSIEELPASDVLSAREIDEWLKRASDTHAIADRQLGLDTEVGDEVTGIDLEAEPDEADASSGDATKAPMPAADRVSIIRHDSPPE